MTAVYAGIDIGGTKCAVTIGRQAADNGAPGRGAAAIEIVDKMQFPTSGTPDGTIAAFLRQLDGLLDKRPAERAALAAIGISCGSPLDSRAGLILSPPNLPGWDRVDIVAPFAAKFGVPAALQNDANACALAEWQWGAGQGTRNMVFLTFGTGMGAGLILDGKLYAGTNDNAGEVGHMRLAEAGPVGYNKIGSFEGFCSGGGIARLAQMRLAARLADGKAPPAWCEPSSAVTAKAVADAARAGDSFARGIMREVAERLGQGLAIIIDVLNPQRVVIGSIFGRARDLLEETMLEVIRAEALPQSAAMCDIVPAGLGEAVGDYAALSVARNAHAEQTAAN